MLSVSYASVKKADKTRQKPNKAIAKLYLLMQVMADTRNFDYCL